MQCGNGDHGRWLLRSACHAVGQMVSDVRCTYVASVSWAVLVCAHSGDTEPMDSLVKAAEHAAFLALTSLRADTRVCPWPAVPAGCGSHCRRLTHSAGVRGAGKGQSHTDVVHHRP